MLFRSVSANAAVSFEELAKAVTGHLWLQMYLFRDREMTREWLRRAKAAGYEAICLTVDSQYRSKRERNIRNEQQASAHKRQQDMLAKEENFIARFAAEEGKRVRGLTAECLALLARYNAAQEARNKK